jgi:hypothetical protein
MIVEGPSGPQYFDQCSVHFEPPDTTVIVVAGSITPEIIHQISVVVGAQARGKPYVLRLLDMSRVEGISAELRSASEQTGVIDAGRGMALFCGSIPLRIIAGSILRLKRLLTGRLTLDPIRTFDTEAEARAWLARRRREVRRELSLPELPEPGDIPDATPR